jgi:hypothetical protein
LQAVFQKERFIDEVKSMPLLHHRKNAARILGTSIRLLDRLLAERELKSNMGREVGGVIRAILKAISGVRYRVEYGSGPFVATIKPEAIVQPEEREAPDDVEF